MATKRTLKARRKKLVEALRSGEYKQTMGRLARKRKDNKIGYCCLGVACKVAGLTENLSLNEDHLNFLGETGILPVSVRDYFGFNDRYGGEFKYKGNTNNLVDLNDRGVRFSTIANIIEKEPEGMFID